MSEILKHLNSIADSLVAGVILIPLVTAALWLHRMRVGSSKSRVIWLVLAAIAFVSSSFLAIEVHSHKGFDNGALFAIDCEMSLLLAVVFAYPFAIKYLGIGVKRLDWAKSYPKGADYEWKTYHQQGRSAGISSSLKGLHFRTQSTFSEERWANMEIEFADEQNFQMWAGISFNMQFDHVYPGTTIKLQIITAEDSRFLAGKSVQAQSQTVSFSFQEMVWQKWSSENVKRYLDLSEIRRIAVVCYTACDDVEFTVSNFALLKTIVNV